MYITVLVCKYAALCNAKGFLLWKPTQRKKNPIITEKLKVDSLAFQFQIKNTSTGKQILKNNPFLKKNLQ
jgi:hypothetical protein